MFDSLLAIASTPRVLDSTGFFPLWIQKNVSTADHRSDSYIPSDKQKMLGSNAKHSNALIDNPNL